MFFLLSLHFLLLYSAACYLHPHARMHTDSDLQFRDLWRSAWYKTQQGWAFLLFLLVFNCGPSERDNKSPDRLFEGHRFDSLSHPLCLILCLSPPTPSKAESGHFDGCTWSKAQTKKKKISLFITDYSAKLDGAAAHSERNQESSRLKRSGGFVTHGAS